VADIIKKIVDF